MQSIFCRPNSRCFRFHHHNPPIAVGLPKGLDSRARRERSSSPRGKKGDQAVGGGGNGDEGERLLLVEKCKDGSSKRYILDDKLQLQSFREDSELMIEEIEKQTAELSWLPSFFKEIILPAGFPDSVSGDYLDYMLLQFSTNVTGWVCHTLVTSSLLQAVGIGTFTGATAAASAAAIRWVSKDGLGAVGRLLIGGRFGKIFDDDPKQWRMYADFIGSAGSIFELCTPVYPEDFLLLASLGNFAKAIAKGLKDPSFRVIQNHFAISGNLGEVAAKEEVWEVMAQLLGLALGILLLDSPGLQKSYFELLIIWFGTRTLHLWLRYLSLSTLRFPTVNFKRARILVKSHVLRNIVPGYVACNKEEDILSWERLLHPRITYAVSIKRIMNTPILREKMEHLLKLYCKEKYILVFHEAQPGQLEFMVTFKVDATSMSVLRSLWQIHWLEKHWGSKTLDILHVVEESLLRLEGSFHDFLEKFEEAGWCLDAINLKVPKDVLFEEVARSTEGNNDVR